jgi:hypothetical protein
MSQQGLSVLPQETLDNIFSYLNIRDRILATDQEDTHSSSYNMLSAKDTTISVSLYLGQHFTDPYNLLSSMLLTDTLISGSRVLEYYVPGSIGDYSDWDFYISDDKKKIYNFMQGAEKSGIKWMTPEEAMEHKFSSDNPHISVTFRDIPYLLMRFDTIVDGEQKDKLLDKLTYIVGNISIDTTGIMEGPAIKSFAQDVILEDGRKKTIVVCRSDYDDFKIINGMLDAHGKKTPIQLIITHISVFETILRFAHSAVQCVITGFCAAHLYAADTYNKQSYIWANGVYTDSTQRSIDKYTERGFNLTRSIQLEKKYSYITNDVIRVMGDADTHIVDIAPCVTGSSISGLKVEQDDMLDIISIKKFQFMAHSWSKRGMELEYNNRVGQYIRNTLEYTAESLINNIIAKVRDMGISDESIKQLKKTEYVIENGYSITIDTMETKYLISDIPVDYFKKYIPRM